MMCALRCLSLKSPTFRTSVAIPFVWHPKQLCLRHLDDRHHLAAISDHGSVSRSHNLKSAPKADSLKWIEPAFDAKHVAESCCFAVIDLSPDNHGILLGC